MPTYEFRCANGHKFQRFYKTMSTAALELPCPECAAVATRQLSAGAGLVFKGSGFYLTDYGKNAHRGSPDAKGGGDTKSEGGGGKAEGGKAEGGKAEGGKAEGGKAESGKADGAKPEGATPPKGGGDTASAKPSSDGPKARSGSGEASKPAPSKPKSE